MKKVCLLAAASLLALSPLATTEASAQVRFGHGGWSGHHGSWGGYRGGWGHRGWGWGGGWGAGLAAGIVGATIGSALAAPAYGYGYDYAPVSYGYPTYGYPAYGAYPAYGYGTTVVDYGPAPAYSYEPVYAPSAVVVRRTYYRPRVAYWGGPRVVRHAYYGRRVAYWGGPRVVRHAYYGHRAYHQRFAYSTRSVRVGYPAGFRTGSVRAGSVHTVGFRGGVHGGGHHFRRY